MRSINTSITDVDDGGDDGGEHDQRELEQVEQRKANKHCNRAVGGAAAAWVAILCVTSKAAPPRTTHHVRCGARQVCRGYRCRQGRIKVVPCHLI